MRRRFFTFAAVAALVLGAVGIANADCMPDFGSQRDQLLDAQAQARFGVQGGLASSSTASITARDQANADPTKLVTLAKGLSAKVVTTLAAPRRPDGPWPGENPQRSSAATRRNGRARPAAHHLSTGARRHDRDRHDRV